MHSDIKGKRRGLRIELVPGQTPRMVLEPWETLVESSAGAYHGKASRVVRVWGRRRLMLIRRFLPYIKTIEVNLLGNGLPSFWIFRGEGVTLTMGLTGFTNANWSQAVAFDLLLPRKTQDSKPLGEILKFLGDVWFATPADIGKQTGLKGAALTEALQAGCQQGKLMYDLAHGVYRLRPLSEKPIDFTKLEYRNVREKQAYDLMTRRHAVDLVSENRIPGSGLEIVGKVSVSEDGRDYRPMLLLGDEGQVMKAECTCSLFRKQGLKNGPCAHLIALRLIHAKREADRKKGSDSRQTITTETRAYTRRTEDGEESRLISLEKTKIRVKWGKTNEKQRQITLRFNSESEARDSYFAQVEELDKKGYLAVAGD